MPTIFARLAKDWNEWNDFPDAAKYRVLCGRRCADGSFGCGGDLGFLISSSAPREETAYWQMAFGPSTVLGQDGVWELSNRAQ